MNRLDDAGVLITGIALGFVAWWFSARRFSRTGRRKITGQSRGWMMEFAAHLGSGIRQFAPAWWAGREPRLVNLLEKAGLYPEWDGDVVAGLQAVASLYAGLMAAVLTGNSLAGLLGVLAGLWLPYAYVKNKKEERQLALLKEFPTAIDMIVLGIEGGLDISAGIKEMIDHSVDGPLIGEFRRLHHDISIGESRPAAFRKMLQRVDAIEIRAAMMSMVQAMEMGSEIGPLMRTQATQLRFNRLMRAEEAANKAPTKMMIPMVLFILPCMFLVIFAPIGINVMRSFGLFGGD